MSNQRKESKGKDSFNWYRYPFRVGGGRLSSIPGFEVKLYKHIGCDSFDVELKPVQPDRLALTKSWLRVFAGKELVLESECANGDRLELSLMVSDDASRASGILKFAGEGKAILDGIAEWKWEER